MVPDLDGLGAAVVGGYLRSRRRSWVADLDARPSVARPIRRNRRGWWRGATVLSGGASTEPIQAARVNRVVCAFRSSAVTPSRQPVRPRRQGQPRAAEARLASSVIKKTVVPTSSSRRATWPMSRAGGPALFECGLPSPMPARLRGRPLSAQRAPLAGDVVAGRTNRAANSGDSSCRMRLARRA